MMFSERTSVWLRIYHHELSRRRRLLQEDPKNYWDVYRKNHKPLVHRCKENHVWVPATFIWIHDGVKRGSYLLYGYHRRGFAEGCSYIDDGYQHTPQICWDCCCTRERIVKILSFEEKKDLKKLRKVSKRRIAPKQTSKVTSLDELDSIFPS